MPVSVKQLRWAHTAQGEAALGASKVNEWDREVKGKKLPERASQTAAGKRKTRAIEKSYK